MPWVNYHSHSLFCDGKAAPEDFITVAIEKGFPAYGYSSHAPVPFSSRWNIDPGKLPAYLEEITRIKNDYADKIQVYTGLEVDFIDGLWGSRASGLKEMAFDYLIGSVHYIGQFPDNTYFCFDGQPEAFFQGMELLYKNDFRKALTVYYDSVRGMVETDVPDIIGHMDKIKMHNTVRTYFSEEDKWYVSQVEETLDQVARFGCIVEVNTRGLYKHNPPMLYPSIWILERIYEKGIPVMINSDSHHPDEIDLGFSYAASVLQDIGFKTLRVLLDGKWQEMPFTENGFSF